MDDTDDESHVTRWFVRSSREAPVARSDVIVGIFNREDLSAGLVATHRAGFGPHARVLDSARGPLDGQLGTAGYQLAIRFAADDADTVLILITAPGRATLATDILDRAGARSVHVAERADPRSAITREAPPPDPATVVPLDSPPADH